MKNILLIGFFISVLLTACSVSDLPSGPGEPGERQASINKLTVGAAFRGVPNGYAPPVDVFNNDKQITSLKESTIEIEADQDIVNQEVNVFHEGGLIYNKGYYYSAVKKKWLPFSLSGEAVRGSNWLTEKAFAKIEIPRPDLVIGENYIITNSCKKHDGEWKCGCVSNSNCGFWMLSSFLLDEFNFPLEPPLPGNLPESEDLELYFIPEGEIYAGGQVWIYAYVKTSKENPDALPRKIKAKITLPDNSESLLDLSKSVNPECPDICRVDYSGVYQPPIFGSYGITLAGEKGEHAITDGSFKVYNKEYFANFFILDSLFEFKLNNLHGEFMKEDETLYASFNGNDITGFNAQVYTGKNALNKEFADKIYAIQGIMKRDIDGLPDEIYLTSQWKDENGKDNFEFIWASKDIVVKLSFDKFDKVEDTYPIIKEYAKKLPIDYVEAMKCLDKPCGDEVLCTPDEGKFKFGSNPLKAESVTYKSPDGIKVVASDTCADGNTLVQYYCGTRRGMGLTQSKETKCRCERGACKVDFAKEFCAGGICYPLSVDMVCDSNGASYNTFKQGRLDLTIDGSSYLIYDMCTSSNSKEAYYCSQIVEFFSVPTAETIRCRDGYLCEDGKCIEISANTQGVGDLNADGIIDNKDVAMFSGILSKGTYVSIADIDGDKKIDPYDGFRLREHAEGRLAIGYTYPIRQFLLKSENSTYSQNDNKTGTFQEIFSNIPISTWTVEHEHKGGGRANCIPPIMKLNLKNVRMRDRLSGMSSYSATGVLRYDEFKMLPECELNSESDVNVLMREYMTYWIFRNFDVPTADIILFANVSFDVPDKQLDKSKKYHYIFLQHYESDNDQVPFTRQFSMSKVLASSSDYDNSWVSYENSNHFAYITFNKNDGSTERLWFDRDTAITYFLLTGFTTLSDKSLFGNERYGYYEESKKLKHIPFDFDSSFGCNADDLFISDIEELPKEKQAEYFAAYYSIARNIFDNPNNLYAMLAEIDKFPFRENKIKMKNTIRVRFYDFALYFSSKEFADRAGQAHVPFVNEAFYKEQARKIASQDYFDMLCADVNIHKGLLRRLG